MQNINIVPMTVELAHQFFNGYQNDRATYSNEKSFKPFIYTKEWVEEYFSKQEQLNHILFSILLDGSPIGEIKLHNISKRHSRCEVSITLKNEEYKNKGYGTQALKSIMQYAKDTLEMNTLLARTLVKNLPAQRLLKKLWFIESYREYGVIYFEKDLNKVEVIHPIKLVPMTKELYRQYEKGFRFDLPPKGLRQNFCQYHYDEETANLSFSLYTALGRITFAVMIEGQPRGFVSILNYDYNRENCYIEFSMQSKEYKNRGYGSKAIIELLKYAKQELKLKRLFAYVNVDNTHARHVLEKIGFVKVQTLDYYGKNSIKYEVEL